MNTLHAAVFVVLAAGTTASLAHPARGSGAPEGGSSFSCSISAWIWEGGFSDDFLLSGNWFDCGLLNGPDPLLDVYFGPVAQFINGAYVGDIYPAGPALLTQNFSSPGVTMLSNSDTTLTVAGATYTSNGVIGDRSDNFPHAGTATLVLDNAVWDGSLTVGRNGGVGRLVFRGASAVTGSISISDGDAGFRNEGAIAFGNTSFPSSTANATWTNTPGSTLTLANTSNSAYPFRGLDNGNLLLNQAGASVVKDGDTASNTIEWDYDGAGLIDIRQGSLNFGAGAMLATELNAVVAQGATLRFSSTEFVGDGSQFIFNSVGDGELAFSNMTGPATLVFRGSHAPSISGTLETDIRNEGEVSIGNDAFSSSTIDATWTNAAGSTLTLINTSNSAYPFRSLDNGNLLLNEAGASLVKDGDNSTNTIEWDYDGAGLIDVRQGSLNFGASRMLADELNATVADSATLRFSNTVFIGDGSQFIFNSVGDGELAFSSMVGPATLVFRGMHAPSISGTLETDIRNEGEVSIGNDSFSTSTTDRTWTNAPGSTLTLANTSSSSYPFRGTGNGNTLVNQADATIVKADDNATNTIEWDLVNNGLIHVRAGRLSIPFGFDCDGGFLIEADATVSIGDGDPALKAPTASIAGTGTIDFPAAPALFNRGVFNPSPRDRDADPEGLVIDVPFVQNDDTAVFRTQVGSLSGKLTCTGVFDINGAVDIQRFGDFEPDGSEQFVVIEADFVSGVFGDPFTNAVPAPGSDTAFGVRTGDLEYDLTYTPTTVVISNVAVIVPPCNPADLAEPTGTLDLADIAAFVAAFSAGDAAADLAEPQGVIDLADIAAFLASFNAGCP